MLRRKWMMSLAAMVAASTLIAGEIDPGIKPGDTPGSFQVKAITGPDAGESLCYV